MTENQLALCPLAMFDGPDRALIELEMAEPIPSPPALSRLAVSLWIGLVAEADAGSTHRRRKLLSVPREVHRSNTSILRLNCLTNLTRGELQVGWDELVDHGAVTSDVHAVPQRIRVSPWTEPR